MTHSALYVNFTDGVYRFTEQTSWMWQKVGLPAGRIYAGGYGLVATDPNTGALFIYQGSPGYWTQIGGAGAEFAVTDDSIYGLTPNKGAVYRYDRYPGTSWTWVGGPASRLYGGDWGLVATDPDGNLWRYTYIPYEHPGNWQLIGGPGAEFAVADRTVFGLTPDKGAVYRYDGYGTSWTYVGGAAAQIATAGNV